ncbi:MAG TPA: hypothetical protein VHD91_10005 [Gaiellaceae bacterium]|nr:hypothetical protein [Gaiellaceae bacterium]
MSTRISPQIRIVALVGLLLAVAGGGTLALSQRQLHGSAAPERVTTSTPAAAPAKPSVAPHAHHTAKPAAPTRPATRPAAPARPARHGNLVDSRLPAALQWQLSQHRIVVVSFYEPRSDLDAISVAEAHAGAVDAKVGFLLVNVLDDAVAGPLTALLPGGGLLPDPGVLVYKAPGYVVYRFDGFADRQTIEQAAASAKAGQSATTVLDPGVAASGTGSTP